MVLYAQGLPQMIMSFPLCPLSGFFAGYAVPCVCSQATRIRRMRLTGAQSVLAVPAAAGFGVQFLLYQLRHSTGFVVVSNGF